MELSICSHLSTIESLTAEINSLSDRIACEEEQHREALAGKEQEHVLKLSKLDERIRRVLATKGEAMQMQPYLSSSMIIIYSSPLIYGHHHHLYYHHHHLYS